MTLARRLTYTIVALTFGLTLMALTPLWVMLGIRASVHLAYDEYKELRMVDGAVLHLGSVLGLLRATQVDGQELAVELGRARRELDRFLEFQFTQSSEAIDHEHKEHVIATSTRDRIDGVLRQLASDSTGDTLLSPGELDGLRSGVENAVDELRRLSDQTASGIEESQARVFARIRQAMVISTILVVVTLVAVAGLSFVQYRGVIRPLHRLRQGVRRIAAGEFSQRLGASSTDEIGEVAREFDRMSEQLETLYRNMEGKIRRASRELARSERLASVGFLAAGIAHEINNPLNIISGGAELMLRRLAADGDGQQGLRLPDAREGLQIIREESFRCKEIIERLLSLARPGGGNRQPVDLTGIAAEVIRNVQTLQQSDGVRIELDARKGASSLVVANDTELKQVLLNLLLNALQALSSDHGCVRIAIRGDRHRTILTVEDDGRGMSRETIERVFEPFFTERRGGEPGMGLGLSISHAIIEAHGGTLRAESAGPGQGSRFTIELPSAVAAETAR